MTLSGETSGDKTYDDLPDDAKQALELFIDLIVQTWTRDPDDIPAIDAWDIVTKRLAQAFELCPIHGCDEEICADDEREDCRAARAEL